MKATRINVSIKGVRAVSDEAIPLCERIMSGVASRANAMDGLADGYRMATRPSKRGGRYVVVAAKTAEAHEKNAARNTLLKARGW